MVELHDLDYADGSASRLWLVDTGDGITQALAWVAEAEVVGYAGTGSGHAIRIRGGMAPTGARMPRSVPRGPRYGVAPR